MYNIEMTPCQNYRYKNALCATEQPEERAARLEQLTVCQQQRIASETYEETEERLRRDRES